MQQSLPGLAQHEAAGLAASVQDVHSFFVAQDARSMEEAASEMVRRRIIERSVGWQRLNYEDKAVRPINLLAGHDRSRRRGRRGLGSAGDEAAGEDRSREGEEGVFHSVCSLCLLLFSRPFYGRMELTRINNEPTVCKHANKPTAGKYQP